MFKTVAVAPRNDMASLLKAPLPFLSVLEMLRRAAATSRVDAASYRIIMQTVTVYQDESLEDVY